MYVMLTLTASVAQRFAMWTLKEEVPGRTNLRIELSKLVTNLEIGSGLGVLGSAPESIPLL